MIHQFRDRKKAKSLRTVAVDQTSETSVAMGEKKIGRQAKRQIEEQTEGLGDRQSKRESKRQSLTDVQTNQQKNR